MQEVLLGTDPLNPDTDGDGVPDGMELKFGTSPFQKDTDHDGLTDGQEIYFFHTNPLNPDSDGDGISDGKEVLITFTNPMDPDTDRDGLTDFQELYVYHTNPLKNDTDGDGLTDGFEINTLKTDPFLQDTDNDSITYIDPTSATGIAQRWNDYDEWKANISSPLMPDTDLDGISDGWEVYLGSGHVPKNILPTPLHLMPNNNDTDGDGLLDGQELYIGNQTSLIYPFISFYLVYPYKTSPVNNDTDADGLSDLTELNVTHTLPYTNDSDNDTLTDYEEIYFHHTNPMSNDTDGDGIPDNYELTDVVLNNSTGLPSWSKYNSTWIAYIKSLNGGTSATNPDTDGDFIPDGAEKTFYFNKTKYGYNMTLDPRNPDQIDQNGAFHRDGIPDGLDLDSDYDGLPDGYEFMGLHDATHNVSSTFITSFVKSGGGGGVFNPDSDGDGLPDGLEVYVLGTSPTSNDTDHDGFSDGLEVRIGTDPLTPTTWSQFSTAMSSYKYVHIATPISISYVGKMVPVRIDAPTGTQQVTVKLYYEQGNSWTGEMKLVYDPSQDSWVLPQDYLFLKDGNYLFKTYMYLSDGNVLTESLSFAINVPLQILNVSDSSPGVIVFESIFLFGFFSIGFTSTIVAMNSKRLSKKIGNFLKKQKGNSEK